MPRTKTNTEKKRKKWNHNFYVGPGYYWDGQPCPGSIPDAGHLFQYLANHPPKANSAFHPSGVGKWVPPSAGKAKAGMVHSASGWMRGVQVKLWDLLRTHAIPERLRGVFTTRRYTNTRLPLPLFFDCDDALVMLEQVMLSEMMCLQEIARHVRPRSLRALFGRTKAQNSVHCTDLPEDGQLEVEYFFKILDQ